MPTSPLRPLAILTGVLLLGTTPAFSLDAEAFIERAMAGFAAMDYEVIFGEASVEGDTVTVLGADVMEFTSNGLPMTIDGPITFSGIVERPDGGFTAASMSTGPIDYTYDDLDPATGEPLEVHLTSGGLTLTNLYFPAGEIDYARSLSIYEEVLLDGWFMSADDYQYLGIERVQIGGSFEPSQTAPAVDVVHTTFVVEGASYLLVKGEPFYDALAAQGREVIEFDLSTSHSWHLASGDFNIESLVVDAPGLGQIEAEAKTTGMTAALAGRVLSTMERAEERLHADDYLGYMEIQEQVMASLPRIRIDSLSLDYVEDGLVGSVRDLGLSALAAGEVDFNDPDQRYLAALAYSFLSDPKSFSVTTTKPLSLSQIVQHADLPARLYSASGAEILVNGGEEPADGAGQNTTGSKGSKER